MQFNVIICIGEDNDVEVTAELIAPEATKKSKVFDDCWQVLAKYKQQHTCPEVLIQLSELLKMCLKKYLLQSVYIFGSDRSSSSHSTKILCLVRDCND